MLFYSVWRFWLLFVWYWFRGGGGGSLLYYLLLPFYAVLQIPRVILDFYSQELYMSYVIGLRAAKLAVTFQVAAHPHCL